MSKPEWFAGTVATGVKVHAMLLDPDAPAMFPRFIRLCSPGTRDVECDEVEGPVTCLNCERVALARRSVPDPPNVRHL